MQVSKAAFNLSGAGLERAATGEPFLGGLLVLLLVFTLGCALGVAFMNRKEFTT